MMRVCFFLLISLLITSCERQSTDGSSLLDQPRPSELSFECTATGCSCDMTAPLKSTRTCAGIAKACTDKGATTMTCSLKGKQTCTCEKSQ
jgi:hypothetical protein